MKTVSFRTKAMRHIKRHKAKYVAGMFCLMVGGIFGIYSFKGKKIDISSDVSNRVKKMSDVMSENKDDLFSGVNLIEHLGRNGHPGNIIYCNETKQVFKSHREATRELGIDSRDLWAYLKGIKPDARGYTFKRIGEAKGSAV